MLGQVYGDANLLYMITRPQDQAENILRPFLKRLIQGQIELYVSPLAVDEALYRLLLARVREVYGGSPLDWLRADSQTLLERLGSEIVAALRQVLKLPHVYLVGIEPDDSLHMLRNTEQYALMPRDALHLAIVQRLELQGIVSDDADFDRVPGLQRHWILNEPVS